VAKGVSMRQSRNPSCRVCNCTPCANTFECRQARGQAAYDERTTTPEPKKTKAKPTPKISKSKFIRNLKEKNPTISDAAVKKALKKAGYGGCAVVALFMLTAFGGILWGAVEIIKEVL
jgi:hypothetical protein